MNYDSNHFPAAQVLVSCEWCRTAVKVTPINYFKQPCISKDKAQSSIVHLANHYPTCSTDQGGKNVILLFETHSAYIFHMLPVRHKYIRHFHPHWQRARKIQIHSWEKKHTVPLCNNGTLYYPLAHNGFLCRLWFCCSILL